MTVVSLALFKKHVRADDFADDDVYLAHLLDTATVSVITATNRTERELRGLSEEGEFPLPLQHAVMMLAAHWYNQRESVSAGQMTQVPDTLQALIRPYRKLVDDASGEDEI
ncbi:MAG: head-tail connector protein [Bacteroidales bacterium]|nr:head-tail connector protein [Bacteroidales bacterium]